MICRWNTFISMSIFAMIGFAISGHRMSAELHLPSGNNESSRSATAGGSKPLHRFIRGDPKSTGVRFIHSPLVICIPPTDPTNSIYCKTINLICGFFADRCSDLGLFFLHHLSCGHNRQHLRMDDYRLNAGFTGWFPKEKLYISLSINWSEPYHQI